MPVSSPEQIAIKILYCLKNYKLALKKQNMQKSILIDSVKKKIQKNIIEN